MKHSSLFVLMLIFVFMNAQVLAGPFLTPEDARSLIEGEELEINKKRFKGNYVYKDENDGGLGFDYSVLEVNEMEHSNKVFQYEVTCITECNDEVYLVLTLVEIII